MLQKHIANVQGDSLKRVVKCVQRFVESLRRGEKKWSFRCMKRNDHFYKKLIINYLSVVFGECPNSF